MLKLPERLLAMLVMINSKSVVICNRFYARSVNSSRNCAFGKGAKMIVYNDKASSNSRGL